MTPASDGSQGSSTTGPGCHFLGPLAEISGSLHQSSIDSYHLVMTNIAMENTSSTAQGGGGSFKNGKPIGEVSWCDAKMAERTR